MLITFDCFRLEMWCLYAIHWHHVFSRMSASVCMASEVGACSLESGFGIGMQKGAFARCARPCCKCRPAFSPGKSLSRCAPLARKVVLKMSRVTFHNGIALRVSLRKKQQITCVMHSPMLQVPLLVFSWKIVVELRASRAKCVWFASFACNF
jgi:hypothetical protein